ncbi:MAG: VWA domain-containing protein [Myxococcales bacterium]|nr:VWA domain-containing protein [Myxococcales bacterium]
MPRHTLAFSALVALLASPLACSDDDGDDASGAGAHDAFGNANTGGAGSGLGGAGDGSGNGSGLGSGGGLTADTACGMGSASAQLTPVNMLVMFDRSASMDDNGKWPNATAALISFFENPASAGLRVAFRFFPDRDPGCNQDGCDPQICSQVLVDIDSLTADPAPADAQEGRLVDAIVNAGQRGGGGTPIHAALDGALRWAGAHQASFPDENTVVIFVTDGEPNGCDENFDNIATLAANALSSSGVHTYAIGLEGSSEAQMNQLAQAGGTGDGIFIGNSANAEQELLDALNAIRGETLSCDFPMPQPTDPSMPIDPARVNVTFTAGDGTANTFAQVNDGASCGSKSAWHYDQPSAPTRITLCPSACERVRSDPNAQLQILIGCSTCGIDQDCGSGAPPGSSGLPPVFVD